MYGLAGYDSHLNQRTVDILQPDESFVHLLGVRQSNIDAPAATTFGGGLQLQISRHVALRTEAQLATILYIPLGFRVATGVSIPLGRGYSTN